MPQMLPQGLKVEGANLLDERDLAVRLESSGITDRVAVVDYGFAGTFEMARACFPSVHLAEPEPRSALPASIWREYLTGAAYALPMLLCVVSMLAFRISLWGGDLDSDTATGLAIGTVCSFLATGGIVQAMARQYLFYSGCGENRMASVAARRWLRAGGWVLAGSAALGSVGSFFYGWFPVSMLATAVKFHLALGAYWLASGLLYVANRQLAIAAATLAGLLVVGGMNRLLGTALVDAQLGGVCTASALALLYAAKVLRDRARNDNGRIHTLLLGRLLYLTAPYLLYGSLYYALLFADRVMAWTASTNAATAPFLFRGDYETPLDIALIAFVLQVGWVQVSMKRFYETLHRHLNCLKVGQTAEFNRAMRSYYLRCMGWFLPLAFLMSFALWIALRQAGWIDGPVASRVALGGMLAAPLLVASLWNAGLMFALSIPSAAVTPVGLALAADLVAGFGFSRTLTFDWAVAGMVVGAVVFFLLSSRNVLRQLRSLDYHYFAGGS